MPVENERKYVLLCDSAVVDEITAAATYSNSIVQSYLQKGEEWSLRIREIRPRHRDDDHDDRIFNPNYVDHILTYKHIIDGEQVEIETDILSEDYEKLNRRALSRLSKIRYRVINNGFDMWDVDLFYRKFSDDLPYFILAEVELPVGQAAPTSIPPIISKHLLYEVPIGNNEFSNTKLCYILYAEEKYQELLKMRIENE